MLKSATRASLRFLLPALFAAMSCVTRAAASDIPKEAHPALWTVHGPKATAYLLGSIHVLPSDINWKTQEILAAMKRADTFLFEIPLDHREKDAEKAQAMQRSIMDRNGLLPPGESLRAMIPAKLVDTYDKAMDKLQLAQGYVDRLQPWLAYTVIESAQFMRSDVAAENGVDVNVYAMANDMEKKTGGLETLEDQLTILTKEEQKSGITALSEKIADVMQDNQGKTVDALITAWAKGDVAGITKLANDSVAKDPALQKALLDDRNARWVKELKTMLAENHIYFITVGAAHLVGPKGVPALLHAAGYAVEGPGFSDAARPPSADHALPDLRLATVRQ